MRYEEFFADPGLLVVPLSQTVRDQATRLRAERRLKTPDAIQAACALEFGEQVPFVTGDRDFAQVAELAVHAVRPWLVKALNLQHHHVELLLGVTGLGTQGDGLADEGLQVGQALAFFVEEGVDHGGVGEDEELLGGVLTGLA